VNEFGDKDGSNSGKSPAGHLELAPRDSIQAALERFAQSTIPDYAAFDDWLADKLTIQNTGLILPQSETAAHRAAYIESLLQLHEDFDQLIRRASESRTTTRESYRRLLNSLKLLIYAKNLLPERTKDAFARSKSFSLSTEVLDKDLSSCTQAEVRVRFFAALARKRDRMALKLLGHLREQDHDLGEVAYLEALCHFQANEYQDAIRCAKEVPSGSFDYSAACATVLESQAFLADTKTLVKELQTHKPNEITPSFLSYLMQVSIRQSDDPKEAVADFNELGKMWAPTGPHTSSDPFFARFNRYSCRIAKELAIAMQDLNRQQEYSTKNSAEERDLLDDDLDPTVQRLLYACMVDSALLDDLIQTEQELRFVPIVKRLVNVPYELQFEDFEESLRTQWELGATEVFVENVANSLEQLLKIEQEDKWLLINLAYAEASATGHKRLGLLQQTLTQYGRLGSREHAITLSVQNARLRHELSPVGWHFFEQANWAFERSLAERSPWQDAGMISLGFFRILEVEFNQRIVIPMLKSLDFTALRALPKPPRTIESGRIPDNIIEKLKKVREGRDAGLELGALHLLLQLTQTIADPDENRKKLLHGAIQRHLTTDGERAYKDGRLSNLISPAVREKYRNPPAHSRYLPQPVAIECRKHVTQALLDITDWTLRP